MQIKNKLEKFLITLSSFLVMALAVLGIRIQADEKKIKTLASNLTTDAQTDPGLAIQEAIRNNRDSKLNAAAHAPLTDSNTQTTIKTVIPGKTITQTVPGTTSSTSSSTKKKTTKTS